VTLAASFAVSADQVSKVHLGRLQSLVTFFSNQIVVHINCLPLVVAMVANVDSNAGQYLHIVAGFCPFDANSSFVDKTNQTHHT
jgi:hypothetical protein